MRKLVVLLVLFCTFALQGQEISMTHKARINNNEIGKETDCNCSLFLRDNKLVAIIDFDDLELFKVLSVVGILEEGDGFKTYLVEAKMDGLVLKVRVILLSNYKGVVVLKENENKGFIYMNKNK